MLNLANLRSTSQYWKTRAVVDRYRRYVVSQAKANLTRGRIVRGKKASYKATSKLHGSIKGYIDKKQKRSIKGKFTGGSELPSLTFEMNNYGKFVDEGVKGSKSTYRESMLSKNKFRGGKQTVPVGPIRKWLKVKGLDERLAFVISRSIYQKGIRASHFFTKPLEKRSKTFKKAYHKAVADDIAKNFANQIAKKIKQAQRKKQIRK